MTRINVVPVEELHDKHLVAEYRELPRVFKLAKAFYDSGKVLHVSTDYVLGKGHVIFFYNKLGFLLKRQTSLIAEMQNRGFRTTHSDVTELEKLAPLRYMGDYTPTDAALKLNRDRIADRLSTMKK